MTYYLWICTPEDYPFSQCFFDQAYPLQEALTELGHNCQIVINEPPHTQENVIIFGGHLIKHEIPKNWIIYNLEQVTEGSPWMVESYLTLLKKNPVWDYIEDNVTKLGVEAKILPVGYMPCMTRLKKQEPTWDIFHYGCLNQRREYVLNVLISKGIKVNVAFNIFGQERDDFISKSRAVINMGFYESKIFNITRCGYLFANRVPVISEIGRGSEPFHETGGFANYSDIIDKCFEVLENPEPVGEKGFDIFSKMSQKDYLCSII